MPKQVTRRSFAKLAGATAIAIPALAECAPAQAQQAQSAAPAADAKPKYGMSKEQEERVKQAVERNERGRGTLRGFPLTYGAEPSFVFKARIKAK